MYPVLFNIFGEPVSAYFGLLGFGFALAIWIAARECKRVGLDHNVMVDLGLWAIILGVLGGRLLHVIADGYFWDYVYWCIDPQKVAWHIPRGECAQAQGIWDAAAKVCRPAERDCFAWLAFWRGGLVYYGGLILVAAFGWWFLKRMRFPVRWGSDIVGMVIPIGLFWGRMGCFFSGCCFGEVSETSPIALRFPQWSAASESQWRAGLLSAPGLESLPVVPTQLFEAIGCLAIAAFLMWWLTPRKKFHGQVMLVFLILYAALRFVIEFWRADDRGALFGLSTSQLISIGCVFVAAALWVRWDKPPKTF